MKGISSFAYGKKKSFRMGTKGKKKKTELEIGPFFKAPKEIHNTMVRVRRKGICWFKRNSGKFAKRTSRAPTWT